MRCWSSPRREAAPAAPVRWPRRVTGSRLPRPERLSLGVRRTASPQADALAGPRRTRRVTRQTFPATALAVAAAVGAERLAELRVSARHTRWARERGGVEHGRGHYPVMVAVHTGLLAGMVAEAALCPPARRRPRPAALAVAAGAQAARWWCVRSLGPRWNTRVLVVPGLPPVTRGPYRWLRHPNYAVVAVEGAALPLACGAWRTALAFTAANAALLAVRLRVENAALAWAAAA